MPSAADIQKKYPPRAGMQQFRLVKPLPFTCARCGAPKKSNLVATSPRGNWDRLLCNGCYGFAVRGAEEPDAPGAVRGSSHRNKRVTNNPVAPDEPAWTPDELAEPHDCPGCGTVIFAQSFCDDDCRRDYLAGDGFMMLPGPDIVAVDDFQQVGPPPEQVRREMAHPPKTPSDGNEAEDGEDIVGVEGEARKRLVVHREREQRLRVAKIDEARRRGDGRLRCEVPGCGFDFAETYGELGDGYAHVHHRTPLAGLKRATKTRLADLAIVCANCHAMIHRGGDVRPLDGLIPAARPAKQRSR